MLNTLIELFCHSNERINDLFHMYFVHGIEHEFDRYLPYVITNMHIETLLHAVCSEICSAFHVEPVFARMFQNFISLASKNLFCLSQRAKN